MLKTVTVTQTDINRGIRDHCFKCPVARAMKRHVKGSIDLYVWGGYVNIWANATNNTAYIDLDDCVANKISDFDAEVPITPFEFEFDFPEWSLR